MMAWSAWNLRGKGDGVETETGGGLGAGAGQGKVDTVKMPLEVGDFNLMAVDKSGCTPLFMAEANSHDEVVSLLEKMLLSNFFGSCFRLQKLLITANGV